MTLVVRGASLYGMERGSHIRKAGEANEFYLSYKSAALKPVSRSRQLI